MSRDWQLVGDDRKIINYIEIKKQTKLVQSQFSISALRVWNQIPQHVRSSTTIDRFKRQLKTFLNTNIGLIEQLQHCVE